MLLSSCFYSLYWLLCKSNRTQASFIYISISFSSFLLIPERVNSWVMYEVRHFEVALAPTCHLVRAAADFSPVKWKVLLIAPVSLSTSSPQCAYCFVLQYVFHLLLSCMYRLGPHGSMGVQIEFKLAIPFSGCNIICGKHSCFLNSAL